MVTITELFILFLEFIFYYYIFRTLSEERKILKDISVMNIIKIIFIANLISFLVGIPLIFLFDYIFQTL